MKGKVALVTGASRGIGAAVARRLAVAGARVALVARNKAALAQLASEIGNGAVGLACDVRDTDTLTRALEQLPELVGDTPEIVVNNAGAFAIAPAADTSVTAFGDMLAVNLTAPFAVVRALLPVLQHRRRGHIVTIGSIADRTVFPGNAAYAASKHGVRALHEVLRAELAGTGIRASLISPAPVDTKLWDPIDPDSRPGFTPRVSMLQATDVADAVLYVLSTSPEVNVDELRISRA